MLVHFDLSKTNNVNFPEIEHDGERKACGYVMSANGQ